MEFSYRQLTEIVPSLSKFLAMKPAARIGIQVARASRQIQDALRDLKESSDELVQKYSTGKNDKGEEAVEKAKDAEKFDAFWKEWNEVLDTKVNLEIKPIEIPAVLEIEAQILYDLESIVVVK
jgi:hypothetical protein